MILNHTQLEEYIRKVKQKNLISLVGGCFDILHFGHMKFLEKAKEGNDLLLVLLENDRRVKQLKGRNRPVFSENERAYVLSQVKSVDAVVLLPENMQDNDYAQLIGIIKPHEIAITENDPNKNKKEIHAKKTGAKIKVIPHIATYSTSDLAKLLGID